MLGYSILVVDDDKSLLNIIQDKLKAEGMNTIAALNGSLGVFKAVSDKPDLIVLDMMLSGGMSGFNVLDELKKDSRTNGIPVIVLTNLDMEEKVAKDIGVVDYFIKSNTDLDVICKRIKEILGKNMMQDGK